jgi:hypothetical protein
MNEQLQAACNVIVHALGECSAYPDVPRSMLVAGMPHALVSDGGVLHSYQTEMLSTVRGVLVGARQAAEDDSKATHMKVEEASENVKIATESLVVASQHVSDYTMCDERNELVSQAADEVSTAETELRAAEKELADYSAPCLEGSQSEGKDDDEMKQRHENWMRARRLGAWAWADVAKRKHHAAVEVLHQGEADLKQRKLEVMEKEKAVMKAMKLHRDRTDLATFDTNRIEVFSSAIRALDDVISNAGKCPEDTNTDAHTTTPPKVEAAGA